MNGLRCRNAGLNDVAQLASLNQQLIIDERHRNRMSLAELTERMSQWLQQDYEAVVFEDGTRCVGYALFRREPEHVYLWQFFVVADRRHEGIGRYALDWLLSNAWSDATRIRLDVLVDNVMAQTFWRTVGFRDYCITMELDHPAPPSEVAQS